MPVIRFLREGRDVECYPGENLRDVALREGIELYGLKGKLGNCGGCGQCITCFVDVRGAAPQALSEFTSVELQKLRRRPQSWRLACQSLVQSSLVVLTRPQTGLSNEEAAWEQALQQPLPPGPLAWPEPPEEPATEEEEGAEKAASRPPTATTDEGDPMEDGER
jgi:ferredoxin